jgi:hypothetical protein
VKNNIVKSCIANLTVPAGTHPARYKIDSGLCQV